MDCRSRGQRRNVPGYVGQVVSKLMAAAIDLANGCVRKPRSMEGKVSERDDGSASYAPLPAPCRNRTRSLSFLTGRSQGLHGDGGKDCREQHAAQPDADCERT